LLVSKVPLAEIRTVAADTNSRTSVALLHVLFSRFWGGNREFVPMAPAIDEMLAQCDAALIIGDAALVLDRSRYQAWDLAEEWKNYTGLPFVFAFWTVRMQALAEMRPGLNLPRIFRVSRDHGLEPASVARIATEWGRRLNLSKNDITSYLTQSIDYDLSSRNREGLALFFRYAHECGAIREAPDLRFLGVSPFTESRHG